MRITVKNQTFVKRLLALSVAGLVACGGGGGSTSPKPVPTPTPNHPVAGTVLSTDCDGTTLVETISNGTGGSTTERTNNSTDCGYVELTAKDAIDFIMSHVTGGYLYDFILVDLDNDNDQDVILTLRDAQKSVGPNNDLTNPEPSVLFRNLGNYEFEVVESDFAVLARYFNSADLNGDGLEDVFMSADHRHYTVDGELIRGSRPMLLLQTVNGNFEDASENIEEVWGEWHGQDSLDFDQDGDVDFLIHDLAGVTHLAINDGTGHFTVRSDIVPNNVVKDYQGGAAASYTNIIAADLNHDGYAEVISVGDIEWYRLPSFIDRGVNPHAAIFRHTGNSYTFDPAKDTFDPFQPDGVEEPDGNGLSSEVLDVNGDGCNDVAVQISNKGTRGWVSTFLGDCNGNLTFSQKLVLDFDYVGAVTYRSMLSDINDDGSTDLILYGPIARKHFFLINTGAGFEQFTGNVDELTLTEEVELITIGNYR